MTELYYACISTGRPENVRKVKAVTDIDFVYYVRPGESDAYLAAGAAKVVEVDGNIVKARNQAIQDANGMYCVQISDDIKSIAIAFLVEGKKRKAPTQFKDAITLMLDNTRRFKSSYTGIATTNNVLNYPGKSVSVNKLIVNDLIMVKDVLFDERADLKEDYELFARIIKKGGTCIRMENILADFPHRENNGGANTYRNPDYERQCNEYVISKHPDLIRWHSKRDNQLEVVYKNIPNRV